MGSFKEFYLNESIEKIYSNGGKKVIVKDGKVTYSDAPEYCKVGEKPNLDFLRKCGMVFAKKT